MAQRSQSVNPIHVGSLHTTFQHDSSVFQDTFRETDHIVDHQEPQHPDDHQGENPKQEAVLQGPKDESSSGRSPGRFPGRIRSVIEDKNPRRNAQPQGFVREYSTPSDNVSNVVAHVDAPFRVRFAAPANTSATVLGISRALLSLFLILSGLDGRKERLTVATELSAPRYGHSARGSSTMRLPRIPNPPKSHADDPPS